MTKHIFMNYLIMNCIAIFGLMLSTNFTIASEQASSQQAFNERFTEGMLTGDSSVFLGSFSQEVKVMPEYDKSFLGKNNAKIYYDALFDQIQISRYERSQMEVLDIGQRRIEIGTFQMTIEHGTKGKSAAEGPVSIPGTYFEVWDTSSKNDHKLLSQAWNYDEKVERENTLLRTSIAGGVRYAHEPIVPIKTAISYELAAKRALSVRLMQQRNTDAMAFGMADDAMYSTHETPPLIGKQAIKDYWRIYAEGWPSFDYLDTNNHQLYVHKDYVLTHNSYNMRWSTRDYSGISTGKGIALFKRNANGILQGYRTIAMHD